MRSLIPPEFDAKHYRRVNADLAAFDDSQLAQHYAAHGRTEGRITSPAMLRQGFLELLATEPSVLEIGPFGRPVVSGRHVKYFDVLDSDGLLARAKAINYPVSVVPRIDYVSPTGDLAIVTDCFSAVISSHAIEHQPDLVRHLEDVSRILTETGRYYLIIPDKRYCFDHFIPGSTLAQVISAHLERRKTHSLENVINHRALTTHNDAARHWRGDHADPGTFESRPARAQAAMAEYLAANGGYVDVHAWQFTPDGFKSIVQGLNDLGLIDLEPVAVYATPNGQLEFTAVLQRSARKPAVARALLDRVDRGNA